MRSTLGVFVAFLGVGACPSFAQTVQFNFGGSITSSFALVGPTYVVGDPFTSSARFDANAADFDSRPDYGRYLVDSWAFQNESWTSGDWSIGLEVFDGTTSNDRFRIYGGFSISGYSRSAEIEVTFPPTTFTSDLLPTSLDLNAALSRQFTDFAADSWIGTYFSHTANITTFTAAIPEPAAAPLILLVASAGFRRHRLRPVS